MSKWLKIFLGALLSAFWTQSELAIENLALRQQLATLKSRNPRPNLSNSDRLFWVVLSHLWGVAYCITCCATSNGNTMASNRVQALLETKESTSWKTWY